MLASLKQHFERKIGLLENLPDAESKECELARLRISHFQDCVLQEMGSTALGCELTESEGPRIDSILEDVMARELTTDEAIAAMAEIITRN